MPDYSEVKTIAEQIFNEFRMRLDDSRKFKHNFFVEYPDVEKFNIYSPILVLGLNPSGGDDNPNQRSLPNLLTYVPQIHETIKDFPDEVKSNAELLAYKPYFKTFFQSFQGLKTPYNPVWYNKEILNEIFKEYSMPMFNDDLKKYLTHFSQYDNQNYVVFADLIQFQRTNSKDVIQHLLDKSLTPLINCYVETLIGFIKPKLVLVANAAVSHYLVDHFHEGKLTSQFDFCDTRIFLGSMLTGQRAMDIYSRHRLFNEIQKFLQDKRF